MSCLHVLSTKLSNARVLIFIGYVLCSLAHLCMNAQGNWNNLLFDPTLCLASLPSPWPLQKDKHPLARLWFLTFPPYFYVFFFSFCCCSTAISLFVWLIYYRPSHNYHLLTIVRALFAFILTSLYTFSSTLCLIFFLSLRPPSFPWETDAYFLFTDLLHGYQLMFMIMVVYFCNRVYAVCGHLLCVCSPIYLLPFILRFCGLYIDVF